MYILIFGLELNAIDNQYGGGIVASCQFVAGIQLGAGILSVRLSK